MKIHALTTGAVRVKQSFLYPGHGPRRQLNLFLPCPLGRLAADALLGDRTRRSAQTRGHR